MNTSTFLGSSSLTARIHCERFCVKVGRSTRGRQLQQRISAVGWVRSPPFRHSCTPISGSSILHDLQTLSWTSEDIRLQSAPAQDPEGILAAPKGGHISRRTFSKQLAEDKSLAEQVERERQKAREELQARREARVQPTSNGELIEYLLSTEQPEMEYETARCRPLLTQEFLAFLKQDIGAERFKPNADEGRVAELEMLQEYLRDALAKLDSQIEGKVAPLERMKRLLTAQDKKATLLEMAGNNEIDNGLLDLLQQNIDAAKAAGQPEPAQFMEKVRDAAKKFVMS